MTHNILIGDKRESMNRDELLKKEVMSRKDAIKSAFSNRLTYDKWDKKSLIYTYNVLTSEVERIDDVQQIEFLLRLFNITPYVIFFSNKKDVEAYKWVHDTIEKEIDDRIGEGFKDHIDDFVDYKDLCSGDCAVFTASH